MHHENFISVGKDLFLKGLVDSFGASLSQRIGESIWITRRGAQLGNLRESDIIEVSLSAPGTVDDQAPKDIEIHRGIYKETSFNAVICASPPYSLALSTNADNKIMPQDSGGQNSLRSIPVVKTREKIAYEELSRLIPPIYKSGYMISVVKEFASYAVGSDLFEAMQFTTAMENSCRIITINKQMTVERPPRRPEHQEQQRRSAIPPGIGVMGRARSSYKRGFGR